MGGLWLSGMRLADEMDPEPQRASLPDTGVQVRLKDLEHHIQRLTLLNQALWELLRERLKLTDPDLEAKIRQVDVRDGAEDGRMTETALRCPSCGRVSSSKHWRCLYCGQQFEKPVMG